MRLIRPLSVLVCLAALLGLQSATTQSTPTLTVLASAGGSGKTFEAAAKHFTEATGVNVKVVQYPYAEVREKQLLELINNTGGLDLVSIDGQIWLAELHRFLDPISLTPAEANRFLPAMLDQFRFGPDKALYALPTRIGGWVLIYRKDLLQAAGASPPRTWDEFLSLATKLTKDGVYGFAPAFKQGNYLVAQWVPFLLSHNAKLLTDDNAKAAFNTPQGREATQFMVDLFRKHKVVPPGAASYEHADVIAAVQQGLAAMALTYSPYFLDMNDPKKSKVAGRLAVSPFIPYDRDSGLTRGVTLLSGWGFGIPKASKNKEAALRFLKFMTSDAEQLRLALENTNAPTTKAVYTDRAYLAKYTAAPDLLTALESAQDRPGVAKWTTVEDALAKELSAAINGSKTVQQALADAENQVNAILR